MSGESTHQMHPFLFEKGPFAPILPVRRDVLWLALIPSATVLLLYSLCLPKYIPGSHAGEFVTAALRDGIPHAPGYPLWCLLAGGFASLFATGAEVWSVAFLSALLGSASCGLLTLWLCQQDVGRRASVVAALFLGAGLATWGQAIVPGVHALTLFLVLATWVSLYQWLATRRMLWVGVLFLLLSLGALYHPTYLPTVAVVIAVLVARRSWPRQGRAWLLALFGFVLGFCPLAYLPTSAQATPFLNSGAPTELRSALEHTLSGFSWHWVSPLEVLSALGREHLYIGALLAFMGWLSLYRRHRGDGLVLAALALFPAVFAMFSRGPVADLHTSEVGPLLLPAFAGIAALAGFGMDALLQKWANDPGPRASTLAALGAALPLALIATHLRTNDYSEYRYCDDYASSVLASLPQNAVLFTSGDVETYPLIYYQGVLFERDDVVLVNRCGSFDWKRIPLDVSELEPSKTQSIEGRAITRLLETDTRPVFSTQIFDLGPRWGWESVGILYRAGPIGGPIHSAESDAAWQKIHFHDLAPVPPEDIRELGHTGAPLDDTARHIAAVYYGALARRHAKDKDMEAKERAATAAYLLLQE